MWKGSSGDFVGLHQGPGIIENGWDKKILHYYPLLKGYCLGHFMCAIFIKRADKAMYTIFRVILQNDEWHKLLSMKCCRIINGELSWA